MKESLLKKLKTKKNIAIIGLSKNAGKTSFVNWLVRHMVDHKIALITTGRDGEEHDLVEGHKKTKVFIPKNTIYATINTEIITQGHYLKILKKTNYFATNKQLWLVKALENLWGETVGPPSVKMQAQLMDEVAKYGISTCIVDGALDRKSIVLSEKIDSTILVVSPAFGSKNEVLSEMKRIMFYCKFSDYQNAPIHDDTIYSPDLNQTLKRKMIFGNELPIANYIHKNKPKVLTFPGALTQKSFDKIYPLIKKNATIWIFRHPIQLHLKSSQLDKLIQTQKVFCHRKFCLDGIAVNSFSHHNKHFDCYEVKELLQQLCPEIPVIDIMQIEKKNDLSFSKK